MEKNLKKQVKIYANIFEDARETGRREADLVMYIVQFFKEALGYDVFAEISKEYQIKDKYCDIGIKIRGQVEILIEVKQPGMRLADRHTDQAESYAMKSGTKWVILTNGIEWNLYHLSFHEQAGMGVESVPVFKMDLIKDLQEKPKEVLAKFALLHKKNYLKGELDKYWKKKTMLTPQALSKALFRLSVIKTLIREINRGAKVRVGIEDVAKALKYLMDKEALADIADIKIRASKVRHHKTRKKKAQSTSVGQGTSTAVSTNKNDKSIT